jgi:tetratricopeptide (TPR) repeat protein
MPDKNSSLKVFLCHSSDDKPSVRDLYDKLTAHGIDAWLDEKKLLAGQQWKLEIPKAVRQADVVIICLSRSSITKEGYVQKEIKSALDIAQEKPEGTIYLIPARLEDCKVPDSLKELQWVDLFEKDGYNNLLKALKARTEKINVPLNESPIDRAKDNDKGIINMSGKIWDRKAPEINPLDTFSNLVKGGSYKTALEVARDKRDELNEFHSQRHSTHSDKQLDFLDFNVWHARALIYTGEKDEGESGLAKLDQTITKLEDDLVKPQNKQPLYPWRRNMVLGRAHNDKGYVHWMDLGHYKIAIKEFSAAIQNYSAINLEQKGDEIDGAIATAYDNLGRVYAQLGNQLRAELLIEYGRQIRSRPGMENRYPLSLNSSAISCLAFGNQHYALDLARQALNWFQETGSIRGEGLSQITIGQAQRYIGTLWSSKKDRDRKIYENYLNEALLTLNKAKEIFTDKVFEPIRLCQIYNEIGCVRRELAKISRDLETVELAKHDLLESIKIAEENKYLVMCVDGCEDLAQIFTAFNDTKTAYKWLSKAKDIIKNVSDNYFFLRDRETHPVDPNPCIEEFWQHLGKIHALRGHIAFDSQNKKGRLANKNFKNTLKEPIEEYVMAAGYFGRFLEIDGKKDQKKIKSISCAGARSSLMNHRVFGEQVYSRLRELNSNAKDIEAINNLFATIKDNYNLQDVWIDQFFGDLVDLLLQTKPASFKERQGT